MPKKERSKPVRRRRAGGLSVKAWTAVPFQEEILQAVILPRIMKCAETCREMNDDGLLLHFCRTYGLEVSRPLWVVWCSILRISIRPEYRLTIEGATSPILAHAATLTGIQVIRPGTPNRRPAQQPKPPTPMGSFASDPIPSGHADPENAGPARRNKGEEPDPMILIGDNGIPAMRG